jgi:hypothetical protein
MSILVGILFFVIVAGVVAHIFRSETSLSNIFWPALGVKSLAGFCLAAIYVFHYKVGDTLLFFDDAVKLSELTNESFRSYLNFLFTSKLPNSLSVDLIFINEPRALLMVKIVSLFSLVSFSNYWLMTFYITLISFFGSWYLVKQINNVFPQITGSAIIAFLFFPSIVFWSSGLIKETLAMASLYFICGVVIRFWFDKTLSVIMWLASVLAVSVLWSLKYYFAGIFLAVIIASLIYRFIGLRVYSFATGPRSYSLWFLIFLLIIMCVSFLHPNFNSSRLLHVMVQNYQIFQKVSRPDAVIVFENLEPTFSSVFLNSPEALFAGLFRPLFFDATNLLSILLSVENLVLLIMAAIALPHIPKIFKSNVSVLLLAIIVYVMLLSIFITLSTPNFGTLARYRVGYLPFFVFLVLLAPPVATRLQKTFVALQNVRTKQELR